MRAAIKKYFCGFCCLLMVAGILVLWLAPSSMPVGAVSSCDIGLMICGLGFFFNFLLLLTHLSTLPDNLRNKKNPLLPDAYRKKRY